MVFSHDGFFAGGHGRPNKIQPRNRHTLVVGIVARISGCPKQKEMSLEDQEDLGKDTVGEMYQGPVDYRLIATKGKGEHLDRPELDVIEAMLRTRELDLLIMEDTGRMVRGAEAVRLGGIAVDHGTRLIGINDCIDTADDNWEADLMEASKEHAGHNRLTSKRIKQRLMNRFRKFGGVTPCEIFGYIKPIGEGTTYDDWQKDPTAERIYKEWLRILRETLNCSAVADWLNEQGVPTGKYARRKVWDGKMVRRITRNTVLKGMPGRGHKHTIKHNETGRRISVKNPDGARFREHAHLAFWSPDDFDEINARLDAKNKSFGRKPVNGVDPLLGVSRKRTRFPGQHARCWYCGRQFVWGGNGMTENLMCSGSRQWRCWDSVGFNGSLSATRIVEVITKELHALDGFDDQFREMVEQARQGPDLTDRWDKLRRAEAATAREKEHFLAAIGIYGPQPMFQEKLAEITANEHAHAKERRALEAFDKRTLILPESTTALRHLLEERFQKLAIGSPEFGVLMQQVVPEFYVYLVRLCDGGHLLPRAKVRLHLGGIVPDVKHAPGLETLLTREVTIDLFEKPPERERIREQAVQLAAQGIDQREIGRRPKAKQATVQKALALHRKMEEFGLDTPYVIVEEPPSDYPKLRRHKNLKYRFEAFDGYERPKL